MDPKSLCLYLILSFSSLMGGQWTQKGAPQFKSFLWRQGFLESGPEPKKALLNQSPGLESGLVQKACPVKFL